MKWTTVHKSLCHNQAIRLKSCISVTVLFSFSPTVGRMQKNKTVFNETRFLNQWSCREVDLLMFRLSSVALVFVGEGLCWGRLHETVKTIGALLKAKPTILCSQI